ncbi:MAG TPA: TIGR03936 family radical SAM-associated protein [Syntrophomonadaceae bacterium]|nr:TIGR03936 family radical SAM-associated protein [Syntrophomonadaceae bacterium]
MHLRAEYYVGPDLRFLSNLDMKRMMARSLRRASIPYALSAGYNPHMKLSIGTVLPVGIWGKREYLDIELREEVEPLVFMHKLNEVLPAGVKINKCQVINSNTKALMRVINAASYAFCFNKGYDLNIIKENIENSESLVVESRGKKKGIDKDLKPGIFKIGVKINSEISSLNILVAAGEPINIRYDELIDLLKVHGVGDNDIIDMFREANYVRVENYFYTPLEKVN